MLDVILRTVFNLPPMQPHLTMAVQTTDVSLSATGNL